MASGNLPERPKFGEGGLVQAMAGLLKPGMRVSVAADDYGRDPIEGEIIRSGAHEIVIRRTDPAVGTVAVHFPRAGFFVTPL